jgi:hypothetical protein
MDSMEGQPSITHFHPGSNHLPHRKAVTRGITRILEERLVVELSRCSNGRDGGPEWVVGSAESSVLCLASATQFQVVAEMGRPRHHPRLHLHLELGISDVLFPALGGRVANLL